MSETQNIIEIQEQKKIIDEIKTNEELKEGINQYIISSSWYAKFEDYIEHQGIFPGEIDNKVLFDSNNCLKSNLSQRSDYVIVSRSRWEKLISWYKGGPAVEVPVILNPKDKEPIVIVNKKNLKFHYEDKKEKIETHNYETILELKNKAIKLFNISENAEVRLIDYYN